MTLAILSLPEAKVAASNPQRFFILFLNFEF
jgi:hypothetical protein